MNILHIFRQNVKKHRIYEKIFKNPLLFKNMVI